MNKVYLLYGIRSFLDENYDEPDFTLLAIYDSREKAEAAKVDWESYNGRYDEYKIMNWKVQ